MTRHDRDTPDDSKAGSDPLVLLPEPFIDDRGAIQPLVDEHMASAVLIRSRKGAVRGNHYHRTDWHYCYVISGAMEYFHRPTGSDEPPGRTRVNAGEMFFTPAMTDHTMYFLEETVFLALARNPRDQQSYEDDVVRIELVSAGELPEAR